MTPDADRLVVAARVALAGAATPTPDIPAWLKSAGLPSDQWDQWIVEQGEAFEVWFRGQLSATPLELACLDRGTFAALQRAAGEVKPSAASLSVLAKLTGYTDRIVEPPAANPVPTPEHAAAILAALPVQALRDALALAEIMETERLR